jgi:hypothetical protein
MMGLLQNKVQALTNVRNIVIAMKAKFYFRKDVGIFGFGMDSNHRF